MPEIVRGFARGRMNKDLDERIVPNGEYRDALNLEISASENSDVGAFENIKGNIELKNKSYNSSTGVYQPWDLARGDYISSLTNAKCIGSVRDTSTEKIYWFITSNEADIIAEYNQVTDLVKPLVVDTNNVLNFSEDYLITGVNIIESVIFWTDNNTEPKKVIIKDWQDSTNDFVTHSQIYGRDFIEQDVTVIKKYPLKRPSLTMSESDRDGEIRTNLNYAFAFLDQDDEYDSLDINTPPFNITFTTAVDFLEGDTLTLDLNDEANEYNELFSIRLQVVEVINTYTYKVKILSIPDEIPTGTLPYDVELDLEDPLFEYKMPRFSYRYKYLDNQYSTFAPFTEAAFLPGEPFKYDSYHGYNLAMTNIARIIKISNFVTSDIPPDVKEIDILYKESNNNLVYKVESIAKNSDTWVANEYVIESEIISSVIEANQILRPWDNVPRKAKSQELIGNRLVYGNYIQGYNMNNKLGQDINHDLQIQIQHDEDTSDILVGNPSKSIKSQRTYQLGVSYIDKLGRQTPVFTSSNATKALAKSFAPLRSIIKAKVNNLPPSWAKYFKYFIKETSNEYYNLAMDRWYDAEDGNIWLSFPSSDRNKVSEESFIELKKKHASDVPITENAKYKIISISNEAPTFIKTTKKLRGSGEHSWFTIAGLSDGFPLPDRTNFYIRNVIWKNLFGGLESANGDLYAAISFGNNTSDYFEIANITTLGDPNNDNSIVRIDLVEPMDDTVSFVSTDGTVQGRISDTFIVTIREAVEENKPEFDGRFFAKIYKDATLQQSILVEDPNPRYGVIRSKNIYARSSNSSNILHWWFFDYARPHPIRRHDPDWHYENQGLVFEPHEYGWGCQVGQDKLDITWHGFGPDQKQAFCRGYWSIWANWDTDNANERPQKDFSDALKTVGTIFRFVGDPNEEVYEIKKIFRTFYTNSDRGIGCHGAGKKWPRRSIRYSIKLDRPMTWVPPIGSSSGSNYGTIEILQNISNLGNKAEFTTENPAIWETEPKESAELDIYYAASDVYDISELNDEKQLEWHNCWSFGNGVESNRIRDDYNAVLLDKNPIVSAVLEEPYQEELKGSGLIYSNIFNSTSGINGLNQFIQAEKITKDLNPSYGTIQKLHARDTDLICLTEDKCFNILANKDALYNADGNANVTSNFNVLGQVTPYVGEFGISTNPESFATYGFRSYFSDKNRGTVLRLSRDGIEEIATKGMGDFFSDNLPYSKSIIGSYDDVNNSYNLTLDTLSPEWQKKLETGVFDRTNCDIADDQSDNIEATTLTFKEDVDGWESRKSFIQESGLSLNGEYYTFKNGIIWKHRANDAYNTFYGVKYDSSLNFLFNEEANNVKVFKTLNYTGSKPRNYIYNVSGTKRYSLAEIQADSLIPTNETVESGWYTNWIATDLQEGSLKTFVNKEGKYYNYIKGLTTYFDDNCDNNVDSNEFSVQGIGRASIQSDDQSDFNVHVYINDTCYKDSFNVHLYVDENC